MDTTFCNTTAFLVGLPSPCWRLFQSWLGTASMLLLFLYRPHHHSVWAPASQLKMVKLPPSIQTYSHNLFSLLIYTASNYSSGAAHLSSVQPIYTDGHSPDAAGYGIPSRRGDKQALVAQLLRSDVWKARIGSTKHLSWIDSWSPGDNIAVHVSGLGYEGVSSSKGTVTARRYYSNSIIDGATLLIVEDII